jgi:hypothetical protein
MALGNETFLCLDDHAVRLGPGDCADLMFTSDSKHLIWTLNDTRGTVKVFADGYVVAQGYCPTGAHLVKEALQTNDDGSITTLLQDDQPLKRLTITPSPNSSWTFLFGGAGSTFASR